MPYLSLVVFHPNKGQPFANIRPLGQIYVETGFNASGLFVELNNGEASDGGDFPEQRFTGAGMFDALLQAKTLDQAVKYLQSVPAETAYIIQVADSETMVSLERATFGSRVLHPESGLLVTYNSFVPPYPPDWQKKLTPPPPESQDPRRQNILNLFATGHWEGRKTVADMLRLMDIEIDKEGAVHDGTVIQVVTEPKSSTIYFRGYGYSD